MPTFNPIQSALAAAQSQETQNSTQIKSGPKSTNTTTKNQAAAPEDQVTISSAARQYQTPPQTLQSQQAKPAIASNNDTDQSGEGH
jgi:hypothetical protein